MKKIHFYSITLLLFMCSSLADAQSFWKERSLNKISIQWSKPILPEGFDVFNTATSRTTISGNFSVGQKVGIAIEVPTAFARIDNDFLFGNVSSEGEFILGNVYLGTEIGNLSNGFFGELGVHLPTNSTGDDFFDGDAAGIGLLSDYAQIQSFTQDVFWIDAKLNYIQSGNGFSFRGRGGLDLGILTENDDFFEQDDSELLLDLGFQAGYDNEKVTVLGGFQTQGILSESDLEFDERFNTLLGLTVSATLNKFRPGLNVKVPVSGPANPSIDAVFGVHLSYLL
ncbi:MAG: hypothetical protein AAF363_03685 [Bacteroidota bacterium]